MAINIKRYMKTHTLTSKTIMLSVAVGFLLVLFSMMLAPSLHAQGLDNAAECGTNVDLKNNEDCSLEKTVDADNPPSSQVSDVVATAINILSAIGGIVAVIMVIVSGFRYVTSGGDANKASSARNGVIYAIVGLIIVAFAQVIVQFALERTSA